MRRPTLKPPTLQATHHLGVLFGVLERIEQLHDG